MRPEYFEALKQNTTYRLVFMNPAWDMRVRIFNIDPKKNDKITYGGLTYRIQDIVLREIGTTSCIKIANLFLIT